MRFATNSGEFGFLVTPAGGHGMYRFQLIVDNKLIGDSEPCFLETAMYQLGNLPRLENARLLAVSTNRDELLSLLNSDEYLHDKTTLPLAESMDRWAVHGYAQRDNVTFVAKSDLEGQARQTYLSSISLSEFESVFDAAYAYWAMTRRPGQGYRS